MQEQLRASHQGDAALPPDPATRRQYLNAARKAIEAIAGTPIKHNDSARAARDFQKNLTALLQAAASAGEMQQAQCLSSVRLPMDGITIDPAAGPLQETGFFPSLPARIFFQQQELPKPSLKQDSNSKWIIAGDETTTSGGTLTLTKNIPASFLSRLFPPEYRLAELLGLGTNRVRGEVFYLDPKLSASIGMVPGHDVESRLRYEIIGYFRGQSWDQGLNVETFRRFMDSRSRVASSVINIGPLIQPKHYYLNDRRISEHQGQDFFRIWDLEKLGERFELESIPMGASAKRETRQMESRTAIIEAIQARLAEWRQQIVSAQLRPLTNSIHATALASALARLKQEEMQLHEANAECLAEKLSAGLPDLTQLQSEIERCDGQPIEKWAGAFCEAIERRCELIELHMFIHALPETARMKALHIYLAASHAASGWRMAK
ncbi:MAG: hypothetical protein AB1813_14200 [Verrucomicrobiota bacterium]